MALVLIPLAGLAALYMAAAFQGSWSAFMQLWQNGRNNADYWNQQAIQWLENLRGWASWIPGWDTIVDTFQNVRSWIWDRVDGIFTGVIDWFNARWLWWKGLWQWDDLIQAFNATLSSMAWQIGRFVDNIIETEIPSLWFAVYGVISSIPQQIAAATQAVRYYIDTRVGAIYDAITGTVITLKDYANALFWSAYNFTVATALTLRQEAAAASIAVYDTITKTGITLKQYTDAAVTAAEGRVWTWVSTWQGLLNWLKSRAATIEDIITDPWSYLAKMLTYGVWLVLEQAFIRIWDGPDP